MLSPDFSVLLGFAGILPLVMLVQYRFYPVIRGRPPVDWVYCIPFVALAGGMVGIAIGLYAEPFSSVISNRGSQGLILLIAVELATVFAVTREIEAAEKREAENENTESNA